MATNFDTVMLVDDNKIDAILNKKVLEKDGFSTNIQVYNSALLALKQLESIAENSAIVKPSLVFVDMMMPEMNGFQFIEKFELLPDSIKDNTKIVFMSGSMLSQDQLEIKMLVDSGSSRSAVSKEFVEEHKLKLTEHVKKKTFRTWNDVIIDVHGTVNERTAFSQHVFTHAYDVVNLPKNVEYHGVLGRDIFYVMGIKLLIPQGYTPSGKDEEELKSYTNRSIGEVDEKKLEELTNGL